ncbi:peptidoglycan-binding domain-containing protein [Roseateles chitinivorans]|uniref:peptidoglycan-binding domain-containing protein n=1 Tax=Roseateles chitinivorans TaxID=2917965 RepID=UPI003D674568
MNLQSIVDGTSKPVAAAAIGSDRQLALEVQLRLTQAGLLEPPADGEFGPISQWALEEFLKRVGASGKAVLDNSVASALLNPNIGALFPLNDSPTLAGRVVEAIRRRGWWITRHPDCVNIVYIEGLSEDGTKNGNLPNKFNDLRMIIRVNIDGEPEVLGSWQGTTEPGAYYVKIKPLDPRGAARIAFGQYKSWSVGMHPRGRPDAHEALIQVKDVTVFRDLNQDFKRDGDMSFTGMFGINQHWGYNYSPDDIGNASAGCLVGRSKDGHRKFISLIKSDPRYKASQGFRFMTAILPADAVQ